MNHSLAIDLNADLGEGFPNDARLLELVSSASIACAAHAGTPETIRETLKIAKRLGVPIGAHPGYADREGFGRIPQQLSKQELAMLVDDQVKRLETVCNEFRLPLRFVKPHGALYNQAQQDSEIAKGVIFGLGRRTLPILGQPRSMIERMAIEANISFVAEGFPERRYEADGSLVPRSRPDAVLINVEEIEAQVVSLVKQGLQTLCIHGDDPAAVEKAKMVRRALDREGIVVRFWGAD